ncbi:MAG TPA: NAD-dependent epimerase/dehydratase family protein, partial [Roseiflexaceae bacterium]|nr:NAD-dependent epimerase/dehydratase family protein [Roseiflexaceae bacterium]
MPRTIIITGIASRLALLVGGALAAQPHTRVVGVGQVLPEAPVEGVRILRCDMRGDTLRELLRSEAADVVVHLDFPDEEWHTGSRDSGGRGNVFRAIEVLGACAAAGVIRVVLRSSTLVYGARPDAPAFIPESAPVTQGTHASLLQDYAEIERVAAEFATRHPALQVALLRCAGVVGGGVSSPLARYLPRRPAPVLLGFDPRIQVLHAHDACLAIALAALADSLAGPVNVAADQPLPLSQAIALAGGRP